MKLKYLFSVLLVSPLMAATTWIGAVDSDFSNPGNWSNGAPGSADTDAIISNGDTVSITTNYSGTNTYQLTINGGSTLNASADFQADRLNIQSTGTVNLTGGSFTLPQTSGPNNGAGLNISSGGMLSISGGSHQINERATINGTFEVVGSNATIRMNQIGTANGDFNFIMDASGVSPITGNLGFSWLSVASASVTVDGAAYTGGPGAITLLDGNEYGNTMPASAITVNNLGTLGTDYTIDIVNNAGGSGLGNDTVIINVIPEPSSSALVVLGALSLFGLRKRL